MGRGPSATKPTSAPLAVEEACRAGKVAFADARGRFALGTQTLHRDPLTKHAFTVPIDVMSLAPTPLGRKWRVQFRSVSAISLCPQRFGLEYVGGRWHGISR